MNIVFNATVCGLANNGGSRTIFKSAEMLENLGHGVEIATCADNFTWFRHKPTIKYISGAFDVIVNVSAFDYNFTRTSSIPIKVAWWRAHESWSNSEEVLTNYYLDEEVKNLVNSKGLQKLLVDRGAKSEVIYQGIDFDQWGDRSLRPKNKIRIGCLHTKQPRKRWEDFIKLSSILGGNGYEYVGIGSVVPEDVSFLTEFIHNANVEQLNNLYSSCHIWFAPTESEGLHNVPMEANLCGCLVVCSDHYLNGMIFDYAFNNTAMIYKFGDIEMAAELIKNPNWGLVDNMNIYLRDKIGSREDNMRKLVVILGKEK
jgi:glycosyltransferase involved in cell wall biosynthesis